MALNIGILGAGITGLTSALALLKHLPAPGLTITIYEVRSAPSTIGGAVNLTPKALRYLNHMGIDSGKLGAECRTIELFDLYTGRKYAAVDFQGPTGKGIGHDDASRFFSARVMRRDLQEALLTAAREHPSINVSWGKKVVKIEESDDDVRLVFEDNTESRHSLLLGCDGIHSAARTLVVEPDRQPTYTGIAVVMAAAQLSSDTKLPWETTGLTSSRRGSFMASYYESSKLWQYIAVVLETKEIEDREGWKTKGSDQKAVRTDILGRFESDAMPELANLVDDAGDWTYYPVHRLPPKGKWVSEKGRCVLLGDSAHAVCWSSAMIEKCLLNFVKMPPQGESTGICIEDAVLFSRAMVKYEKHNFNAVFAAYEQVRRPHIDSAYDKAVQRWETVKDSGALVYGMMKFLTPWFLWWTAQAREEEFALDYSNYEFSI